MVPLIKAVEMSSLSMPAAQMPPAMIPGMAPRPDNEDVSRQGYNQIMYYYYIIKIQQKLFIAYFINFGGKSHENFAEQINQFLDDN
ncbi:unnamed protein product [Rhizophagus irregularis]|nr:unnamed protein product [Rhizophagus irregularis]CAB4424700.1 unnamed protein product [Rhizophagus irregularis]